MKNIKDKKGVSLLLTLLIMAVLLAIAFGVSRLTLGEIKLGRDISKSFIAYYAAEAGTEWAIYKQRIGGGAYAIPDCSVELENESSYGIDIEGILIRSIGCYKDISRAIEISF